MPTIEVALQLWRGLVHDLDPNMVRGGAQGLDDEENLLLGQRRTLLCKDINVMRDRVSDDNGDTTDENK